MSTNFYARKKKPREVYDEYRIGVRSNTKFYKTNYNDEDTLVFRTDEELIDFIKNTELYDFIDEYNKKYSIDDMIKLIKGE